METLIQQLINGLALGGIYALIALGYTMVYGVLRLINFAHGDVYMLGTFAGYYVALRFGFSEANPSFIRAAGLLLAAMATCAVVGLAIERLAYRPVRRASRLTALITAIGVSLFLENLGQIVFGANPKFFPQVLPARQFQVYGAATVTTPDLMILGASLLLTIGLHQLVHRSAFGRAMRAVAHDLDTAKLMGIDTDRIIALTFALGSALAAAAGVLVALRYPKFDPLIGVTTGLKAFIAAVLGGIGNVTGAVLGGIIIGLAETLATGYLPAALNPYKDAVAFAILVTVLLARPTGILGTTAPEKV
ncbi:MAG: branched-chain amino acid ABC transporter permease [Chloracidobacterium sp.]|uniref:Branched-chain amino acid ABC transporter permease n=1 Tax=Chloracidobacterium validum TaxID=2821543 RepID=A0ABX8BC23_9BACT|nr:branched-chain amino acid ABC transporter permease [Chloracidobacterium validum]QUW04481.1 branched-chain amino acid ABC transporter permease [Chloracidobacterium validum]